MIHTCCKLLLALVMAGIIIISGPESTSGPAASPVDKAQEDLGRFFYPSQAGVKWKAHFIMPQESLERLFGADWIHHNISSNRQKIRLTFDEECFVSSLKYMPDRLVTFEKLLRVDTIKLPHAF